MMASTSKQTHNLLASVKENKISTTEPGYTVEENNRLSSRKRKASIDRERNNKKLRASSKNPNTCTPGHPSVEDVRTGPSKREADPDESRNKGGKRKAGTDPQTPEKRRRIDSDAKAVAIKTSTPKKAALEDIKAEQAKASTGGETSKKKQKDLETSDRKAENTPLKVNTSRVDFEAKYQQHNKIGEGGFGAVYAGIRLMDHLPVAIKHIKGPNTELEQDVPQIPLEVALMQRVSSGLESVGKSAAVSLLDWYYLDRELVLVMERPYPCMNLTKYLRKQGGSLMEDDAKILMAQLVEGFIEMHKKGVFHRDIKLANILVEGGSKIPRVRIIDFGCGCFERKKPHRVYDGTPTLAPPEWHALKMFKEIDTTVWQLGAVLYRLLHGYLFDTVSFMTGRIGISNKLSEECQDFFKLCLAIRPKERGCLQQLQQHPWLKQDSN